jgi:hypothetical protein
MGYTNFIYFVIYKISNMEVLTDLKKDEQAQHLEKMIKDPKYLKKCGLSIAPVGMIFNENLKPITGFELAVMNQNNEIREHTLIEDSSKYETFLNVMLLPTILVLKAPEPEPKPTLKTAPEPKPTLKTAPEPKPKPTLKTAPEPKPTLKTAPEPASTPGSEIQLADALLLGLDLTTS